ncbi:DUF3072 domain-containing protein [Actinomycetospora termitidis]|uniref:DUF3072 domain-containing protein n=1 Tax=Actinomycetospora termitidis TaxID=3053470 RepID=UPI003CE546B3
MSETDTRDSLPSDTPDGKDPGRHTDDTRAAPEAPDPHEVKAPGGDSAAEKDPAQWVTGDEPMTGPQASYLETLAHQAGEEPPSGLTKAQAHDEIERLQGSDSDPAGDPSKQERPTTEWVTGEEPMTGPQASYLETLAQRAGEEPPKDLTKSQASRAIDDLQKRTQE